jgi:hypothetical protein
MVEGTIFACGFSKKYNLSLLSIEDRVLDRCQAFDRLASVDAHPCPLSGSMGGEGEKEALESNRFSASPSLIPQLRFIRVSELGLSTEGSNKKIVYAYISEIALRKTTKNTKIFAKILAKIS